MSLRYKFHCHHCATTLTLSGFTAKIAKLSAILKYGWLKDAEKWHCPPCQEKLNLKPREMRDLYLESK